MLADSPTNLSGNSTSISDSFIEAVSEVVFSGSAIYHLQAGTLPDWCGFCVDSAIERHYHWQEPLQQYLCWWHALDANNEMKKWIEKPLNFHALQWHLAVASSYYTAAIELFSDQLEEIYVEKRINYETATCDVLDFGDNKGLALEVAIALDESGLSLTEVSSITSTPLAVKTETLSLADISNGAPQVLAGSQPGEVLPPFYNGISWVLIQVSSFSRPTFDQLSAPLLRDSMREWRTERINTLVTTWINKLTQV